MPIKPPNVLLTASPRSVTVREALASGLPVLTTRASGAADLIDDTCGRLVPAGNIDALVENLRWFNKNREQLLAMNRSARTRAEQCTWKNYRHCVNEAVTPFV